MGPFTGSRSSASKLASQVSDLTLGEAATKKTSAPALVARPAGFDPAKAFVKDLTAKLSNR